MARVKEAKASSKIPDGPKVNGFPRAMDASGKEEDAVERRILRSQYLKVRNHITDERDDILRSDSNKFKTIIEEVDNLHELVQKPREQLADAEALYGIANTLVASVKGYTTEGMTPADFVSCLLREFGQQCGMEDQTRTVVCFSDIGKRVSDVFKNAPGCCTMVGPMNCEVKKRKIVAHRKHTKPTENTRPEEVDQCTDKEKTDTDKNMASMFGILRKNHKVKLENLILNRVSFSQTVENLFALSFLVKDGRAEISVDESGSQFVSPRNAPTANAIRSGEASYYHFIFRYDFEDWKLMLSSVGDGEELMPDRIHGNETTNAPLESEAAPTRQPTTPIRKLCRNRGLVMQEQVVADSPESDDSSAARATDTRKGKRKIS